MNKIIIATTVAFMVFAGSFVFAASDTMMQAQTAYGYKHSYFSEKNAPINKQDHRRYHEQDHRRYHEQDHRRYHEQDHRRYHEQDHRRYHEQDHRRYRNQCPYRYRNQCPYCNCRQGHRGWHSK